MPVPFACPHCGEQTLVDEQYAGHSGPCIGCGKPIVVPPFGAGLAVALARPPAATMSARSKYLFIGLCILTALVGIATVATLITGPLLQAARINTNRRVCAGNLRRIFAALEQYEQRHGTLPSAAVTDAQGKPLYSWRVLILPYLGPQEQRLYNQFRLDEPWNSPSNLLILKQMPAVFRSPGDDTAAPDETSYVVIAGNSTPFPRGQPFNSGQILDGKHNTILVVEAAGTKIAWTQPKDLSDSSLSFQIGVDLGGNHPKGMNALFADGKVRFLPDSLSSEEVADMTTANGRERARGLGTDY